MRKYIILACGFLAALACSVSMAAPAFASETEPEVLIKKEKVTTTTELNSAVELEVTDLKAVLGLASTIRCSDVIMGHVNAGGKEGEITSILTLTGEEITESKPLACTNVKNCSEPLVYWVNLVGDTMLLEYMAPPHPWPWLIPIMAHFGWKVECMSTKISDTCEAEEHEGRWPGFLILANGTVVFLASELEEENAMFRCSLGGEKVAVLSSPEELGQLESGTEAAEVS